MSDPTERLLNGRLDTLILKTLEEGPRHGYGIARWLEAPTDERIQVDESSLYPALHRLHEQALVEAEWGTSELDRRATFYRLLRKGRRRLERATAEWRDFADAVGAVLLGERT